MIKKKLRQKAETLQGWADELSELNENKQLLEARARVAPETARAGVIELQDRLGEMAKELQAASAQVPSEKVRQTSQKTEVLDHLLYILNFYMKTYSDEPMSRSPSPQNKSLTFARWLFLIADEDRPRARNRLTPDTIDSAAKQALREYMSAAEYAACVHETSATLINPSDRR
jgi:hypothetical protein